MLKSILLLVLFGSFSLFAQVIEAPVNPIDFEQNPSGIEWRKIDTKHFEIIFPKEVEREAQRAAHLLEKAYPYVSRGLETEPKKISLVLQNQSTESNGFVTLAPRRSEWYMTPSVDPMLTNTEWLKTLSIHEFRHVVQFQKTRRGFNEFYEILFGEIGQAIGLGLTLPPWYLEGDAVGTETALTRGGRGRLPLFERDLRTLLLSGMKFDYDKAHLRSFEDYVPNHYYYGYFLTTHMKNHYGERFMSQVANRSAESSYNPLTFYNAVDALAPTQNFEKFYQEAMRELITEWQKKFNEIRPTDYQVTSPAKFHGWTNYRFPQVTSDGKVLALKNGLSYIDQFVLLDKGKEELLFYPGPLSQEFPYKLRGDRFAFLEHELDPRWGYRNFTRLKVYDIGKRREILDLRETKYRLATLDHTAQKLALVRWAEGQDQKVVVTDLKGKITQEFTIAYDEVITSIDWITDSELVMVQRNHQDLKTIRKLSLASGSVSEVVAPTLTNLGFINVSEGQILIESPESGIDNIFLVKEGKLTQITSSLFGAYAPTIHDGKLVYSDYSAQGMNVVTKTKELASEEKSSDSFVPFYEKFAKEEKFSELESEYLKTETHKSEPYSQFKHAINLHSWMILVPPLSSSIVLQGYSRDILNKFSLSAGASYNLNERTTMGFVGAAWSHYYPVFDIRAAYGTRRQDIFNGVREVDNKWEEGSVDLGMTIPWRRITGRFVQNFTFRSFAKLIRVTNKLDYDPEDLRDSSLFSPGVDVRYSMLSRMATRDLYPRLGVSLAGHLEEGSDIAGESQKGSIQSADGRLYLPGVMLHHSFYHQFAYEKQRDNFYQYSSFIFYPRGTRSVFLEELRKYSGNYTLPLFYPDWHWSRYFYLKRVSFNGFYDALDGDFRGFNYRASSAGWEVLLDTNFLRIMLPISWGVRGSYVIEGLERKNNYEIFLSSLLGVF